MSQNLPSIYAKQYASNIQLLLQQMQSKLRPYVTIGSYKGEAGSPVDQIGLVEMQAVGARFSPMGRVDAPVDRRWLYPSDFDLPQLVDSFDELRMLLDPKSKLVENARAAANRKIDNIILAACFGDAKTGKEGGTTVSWAAQTGQIVAVNQGASGNTGLTVAKLRKAKQILMANEVDLETDMIVCPITSIQHDNLLAEAQIISTDFNDRPVLVDGKLSRFLGINFVHCERLAVDGSSYRRVPVYAKSGMHLGFWNDITTSISQRNDLTSEPWQAYLKMTLGATRLEEKKIVEVKCAE